MGVFARSGKNDDVMTHCANESVLSLFAISLRLAISNLS